MRTQLASFLLLSFLGMMPQHARAHALLISSSPQAQATVRGPDIAIDMKFNSRIDASRSRIVLVSADGTTNSLQLQKQTVSNELFSHAQLKPGTYTLRWLVLATDGHITRGSFPFKVR